MNIMLDYTRSLHKFDTATKGNDHSGGMDDLNSYKKAEGGGQVPKT